MNSIIIVDIDDVKLPWQHISREYVNVTFCQLKLKHASLSQSVFQVKKSQTADSVMWQQWRQYHCMRQQQATCSNQPKILILASPLRAIQERICHPSTKVSWLFDELSDNNASDNGLSLSASVAVNKQISKMIPTPGNNCNTRGIPS